MKVDVTRARNKRALSSEQRGQWIAAISDDEAEALEDQMCDYVPRLARSPDRMDALVWALTELSGDDEQEIFQDWLFSM